MEVKDFDRIPESIIPEAKVFIKDVVSKLHTEPALSETLHGHAAGILAQVALGGDMDTQEKQRAHLKEAANKLIAKYGPGMIDFMRPELREALGLEDNK